MTETFGALWDLNDNFNVMRRFPGLVSHQFCVEFVRQRAEIIGMIQTELKIPHAERIRTIRLDRKLPCRAARRLDELFRFILGEYPDFPLRNHSR